MRYNLTPARMAIIKKTRKTSVGQNMEKRGLLCTVVDGNVNWWSHYGKQPGVSSKN